MGSSTVWFRFRLMRRHLAYHSGQLHWVCRIMTVSSEGGPGPGLVRLVLESADEIGCAWASDVLGWSRPSWRVLCSIFGALLSMLGEVRFLLNCVGGRVFEVVILLVIGDLCTSSTVHVTGREVVRGSGAPLLEVFGMGFSSARSGEKMCVASFVVVLMQMVTCSGSALSSIGFNSWKSTVSRSEYHGQVSGLGVCSVTVGCHRCLVESVPLLGQRLRRKLPGISWRLVWVLILLRLFFLLGPCSWF